MLAIQIICRFKALKYLPLGILVRNNSRFLIPKMGASKYLALYLIPLITICIKSQIYDKLITLPAECNSTGNGNTNFIGESAFLSLLGSCEIIIDKFHDRKCMSKSNIIIWTRFDSKLVTINCNSSYQLDVNAVFEKSQPTQSTTRVEYKQYSTAKHSNKFTRIYNVQILWSAQANIATKFIITKRDQLGIQPVSEPISILLINRLDGKFTRNRMGDT